MNLTKKYSINMKYDQFGRDVENTFEDSNEKILIDFFENSICSLKQANKQRYTMVELGSNYSYYSMLFKKILTPEKTFNIMVDPYEKFLNSGIEHFKINNLEGVFLKKRIYNPELWCNIEFDCPVTGVDELIEEYNIDELDVLHADIDRSELLALNTAKKSLLAKKINFIFILTHTDELHNLCKKELIEYGYNCIVDHADRNIGWDGLLVFKKI